MRDYRAVPLEVKSLSDTGEFTGYGSVFDYTDLYDDQVIKGAFVDSLAKKMPKLLWQHNSNEPVGVYTRAIEDDHGLFVEGQLALKTSRGAEAYELLKIKAISGMSIGYNVIDSVFDKQTGISVLEKLDLWEISLVTFPANELATVQSVKQLEEINSLADAEKFLREAGGFSKTQARGFVSRLKTINVETTELEHLCKKYASIFANERK